MEVPIQAPDTEKAAMFPKTRWTLVVRSGNSGEEESAHAEKALAELCEIYWPPLYLYLRRAGKSPQDSEDMVQDFFAHVVRRDFFERADPAQGKLRSFLLKSLKNFAVDRHKFETAEKRGGNVHLLSIDHDQAERQLSIEQSSHLAPDVAYDRQWALSVLEGALDSVADQYSENGKKQLFDALSPLIAWNVRARPQKEVAEELGLTDSAMRVALHRLRSKFKDAIRGRVAETVVGGSKEIDREIEELFAALA